jgi:hypothetical protein
MDIIKEAVSQNFCLWMMMKYDKIIVHLAKIIYWFQNKYNLSINNELGNWTLKVNIPKSK